MHPLLRAAVYFSLFISLCIVGLCKHIKKSPTTELNLTPVIGVVAQELSPSAAEKYPAYTSYIAASYVKAVESSGARVVPIPINKNETYYRNLLNSINGVVLPGGSSLNGPGNPYYDTTSYIYKIATEINKAGKKFPILGVCLGYEFLLTVANEDKNELTQCDIVFESYSLTFTIPYAETALYSKLTKSQYDILRTSNVTLNHHRWCLLPNTFNQTPLEKNWKITSTSVSSKGLNFIASVEHKKYPIFGIQFHPEKVAYEWRHPTPHSADALNANRYFYDAFVEYARKNSNKFDDPAKESRWLIYNYPVTYTDADSDFMQIYVF